MRVSLFASVAAVLLAMGTVCAQNSRRDREYPELVVESDGRMGACDSLQFTNIKDENGKLTGINTSSPSAMTRSCISGRTATASFRRKA